MLALILDTETHTLNGLPVQIAYLSYPDPALEANLFFNPGAPIDPAATAVHHIIDADVQDAPSCQSFALPDGTTHLIGHNIAYDLQALARCGVDITPLRAICTLALSRHLWPQLASHTLSAVLYALARDPAQARQMIRNAHDASADVRLVLALLKFIRHHSGVHDIEALYQLSEQARVPQRMPFGKHKGLPIAELPADYAQWLLGQSELDPYLRHALNERNP